MKRTLLMGLIVAASLQGCGVEVPILLAAGAGGAGVMMAQDRRSSEVYLDDQHIENKASTAINKAFDEKTHHVSVTSFNRNVLISGEVPTPAARQEVARVVANIDNVKVVYNQLVAAAPSSASIRSSDTYITSDVKMGLVRVENFHSDYVKVVTESGTVFLMGLVTREEARIAAEVASSTNNVQRVVKLFEYIN